MSFTYIRELLILAAWRHYFFQRDTKGLFSKCCALLALELDLAIGSIVILIETSCSQT